MLRCLFAFILLLPQGEALFSQFDLSFNAGDTLYVFSRNGLNSRSSPGLDGEIESKLSYGDTVVVLVSGRNYGTTIDKRNGNWLKCQQLNGPSGYLYSGYLSRFYPPNVPDNKYVIGADHFLSNLLNWMDGIIEKTDSLVYQSAIEKVLCKTCESVTKSDFAFYAKGSSTFIETGDETMSYIYHTTTIDFNDFINFIELYANLFSQYSTSDATKEFHYSISESEPPEYRKIEVKGIYTIKIFNQFNRICIQISDY